MWNARKALGEGRESLLSHKYSLLFWNQWSLYFYHLLHLLFGLMEPLPLGFTAGSQCVNIEYLLDSWLGQNACCILRRQEVCLTMLNSTWCDSHWLDSDKVNWPCIVQKCSKDFSHLLAMWVEAVDPNVFGRLRQHFDTSTPWHLAFHIDHSLHLQLLWIQGRFHDRALGFQGTRATMVGFQGPIQSSSKVRLR